MFNKKARMAVRFDTIRICLPRTYNFQPCHGNKVTNYILIFQVYYYVLICNVPQYVSTVHFYAHRTYHRNTQAKVQQYHLMMTCAVSILILKTKGFTVS